MQAVPNCSMKLIADVLLTLIQSANIPKIPSFIEKRGQTQSQKKAIDSYISLLQDLSKHYSNGLYQHLISEKKNQNTKQITSSHA